MSKMTPQDAYNKLEARNVDIARISDASSILSNDAETKMPSGSAESRSAVLQTLAKTKHGLSTDPKVGEWLDKAAEKRNDLTPVQQRNLELMERNWTIDSATPENLAIALSEVYAEGCALHAVEKETRTGDFKAYEEFLRRAFDVAREKGQIKRDVLGMDSTYAALLDNHNPGTSVETMEAQLAKLDKALPDLIKEVTERQGKQGPAQNLKGPFSVEQQMALNKWGLETTGFDFTRGRIDAIAGHPSSGGGRDDTRLTTFINKSNFLDSFQCTVHEGGHGMYSLATINGGDQPVHAALGMTIHESQSMIIEYQACMTPGFINLMALKAQEVFGHSPDLEGANLQKLLYAVKPSLIRVYADELTYPMHVSLRAEIEKAVIEGDMDVSDMPDAWNEGMKKRLGIVPDNHADGVLQDVHWFVGAAGYFPAYALGAMTAAQLFHAAETAHPNLRDDIAKGDFNLLNTWLNANIRERGSIVDADQLITDATGHPLNSDIHIAHLKARYLDGPDI